MVNLIVDFLGRCAGLLVAGLVFYFGVKLILLLFLKSKVLYLTAFIIASILILGTYTYLNGWKVGNIDYFIGVSLWFMYDFVGFKKKINKLEKASLD